MEFSRTFTLWPYVQWSKDGRVLQGDRFCLTLVILYNSHGITSSCLGVLASWTNPFSSTTWSQQYISIIWMTWRRQITSTDMLHTWNACGRTVLKLVLDSLIRTPFWYASNSLWMFHVVLGVGTRHQSLGPESVDIDFARTRQRMDCIPRWMSINPNQ